MVNDHQNHALHDTIDGEPRPETSDVTNIGVPTLKARGLTVSEKHGSPMQSRQSVRPLRFSLSPRVALDLAIPSMSQGTVTYDRRMLTPPSLLP